MDKDSKYKKLFSKNLNYYMTLKNKTQTDIINDLLFLAGAMEHDFLE